MKLTEPEPNDIVAAKSMPGERGATYVFDEPPPPRSNADQPGGSPPRSDLHVSQNAKSPLPVGARGFEVILKRVMTSFFNEMHIHTHADLATTYSPMS